MAAPGGGDDHGGHAAAAALPPPAPKKIALVLKTLTNPFFIDIEKGARRAEQEFGVVLEVKTGSEETAVEQQIQIVEGFIGAHVDALVIAPSDSQRLVPILKKAQNAGIAIVNIDNRLDPDVMASEHMAAPPFISVDNVAASYASVKLVAGRIKKPVQAGLIEGLPNAENARSRLTGATRAFAENPNIHLVEQASAHWKIDEARDVAQRMFARHPDISVLYCANDMMAIGAIRYLQDSGRKGVTVIGYDAIDEARVAIKSGLMTVSVDQQAGQQGYQGVALAVRALKGEKLPPVTLIEARLVTAATLAAPR
ncbi:substrate-binding domain-containing protein [Rugamonas sp.]|uniref:substrate-binding domain-containing protein n=1 Tax=Rugamonas sp. TaxID=1926287 RepID=UPI0025D8B166|nr:substrate-binding domain-containing protein [Rugamonas sp.]